MFYILFTFSVCKMSTKIVVALFTPAHLQLIHLPYCTQNTELAFTLQLQTQHELTLFLDMLSFVLQLLTITLVFSRLTFKPLLSRASFHFENSFLNPLIISPRYKSSAYSNSLSAPYLANSVTTSTTTAKGKGDSSDPWSIHTLASNSDSTMTCLCSLIQTNHRSNQNF